MLKSTAAECSVTNLQMVLDRVKLEFVKGLSVQAVQLRQIWNRLDAGQCDGDISSASFIAHKICGVAKTVGFAELGDAAEALEVALCRVTSATPDTKELARLLSCLIDEMELVGSHDRG